jgi:hypothetical protein
MAKRKKTLFSRVRFPVIVVGLLALTFVLGGAAGAFMYATGKAVVNEPRLVMVSHTEYAYSAPGQIIARITDFQGIPVAVNNCTTMILYPNKTSFVSSGLMTASTIAGDYYYNFTTPVGPEGTYEYQATCFYNPGKNASVTNSFHLTGNFNAILGNLTSINSSLGAIQGNLTALSSQLNANISTVLSSLSNVNSSLYQHITDVNTSVTSLSAAVGGNFSVLNTVLAANFTQLQANVTQILAGFNNITVNVNLTPVLDAIASVNSTIVGLQSSMAANFTYTNSLITSMNASMEANFASVQTNFSTVLSFLSTINATVSAQNYTAALAEINSTTQSTYTYLTTTLVNKIDDALTQLGIMNATLNRIETTTLSINSTTNQILQNQQDAVNMQVFSG